MADIVFAVKRSQTLNTPTNLANGELAYSFSSDKLFIGQTANSSSAVSISYIGGKLLVDKVANLESILLGGGGVSQDNISISDTATIDKIVLSSFIENGMMYTNSVGEVLQVAGSVGGVMQVSANGQPTFGALNGGEF